MNSPTSGPLGNYSKLLVSDATIFFDQNTCFLKDVLVSKQKISYLLDFDQKFKSVRTKVLIKSLRNGEPVNFFKVFHTSVTSII